MIPFTYISLTTFLLYIITNNNFIGMISFNCAFGVFMGFNSAFFIDYNGYNKIIELSKEYHAVSYFQIYIMDFLGHTFPVIYMFFTIKDDIYISESAFISINMHLLWSFLTCDGFNLNDVYFSDCTYKLCNNQWKKLWIFTIIGHLLPGLYLSYKYS